VLKITEKGKLKEKYWSPKSKRYLYKDVTKSAIKLLFEPCELDKACTLKSVFKLLESNLDQFNAVLGNWTKELVTEGLKTKPAPYKVGPEEIEYLEVYYNPIQTRWKKYGDNFCGFNRPDFHGMGFERKKTKYFGWKNSDGSKAVEAAKGSRTPYGVSFSAPNTLINIPLKLNNKFTIYEEDMNNKVTTTNRGWRELITLDNPEYTLGQILYSIVWELSWNGNPANRDKRMKEIKDIADSFKALTKKAKKK